MNNELKYERYTQRSLIVRATDLQRKIHGELIRDIGGRWVWNSKGGAGWLVPVENERLLITLLKKINDSQNEIQTVKKQTIVEKPVVQQEPPEEVVDEKGQELDKILSNAKSRKGQHKYHRAVSESEEESESEKEEKQETEIVEVKTGDEESSSEEENNVPVAKKEQPAPKKAPSPPPPPVVVKKEKVAVVEKSPPHKSPPVVVEKEKKQKHKKKKKESSSESSSESSESEPVKKKKEKHAHKKEKKNEKKKKEFAESSDERYLRKKREEESRKFEKEKRDYERKKTEKEERRRQEERRLRRESKRMSGEKKIESTRDRNRGVEKKPEKTSSLYDTKPRTRYLSSDSSKSSSTDDFPVPETPKHYSRKHPVDNSFLEKNVKDITRKIKQKRTSGTKEKRKF